MEPSYFAAARKREERAEHGSSREVTPGNSEVEAEGSLQFVSSRPAEQYSKTPADVKEEGGGGKEVRRAGAWEFSNADIQSSAEFCDSKIFTLDFD